jgi:hypothetical protein
MDVVVESPRPTMSRTERRAVTVILVLMASLSFWLASNQTFDPQYRQPNEPFNTDFYRQQAISLLDGRLDVPFKQYRYNECFLREGQCYGYFGLAPSILRIAGFLVSGSTDLNPSPLVIALGATVALWAAIDLALGVAGAEPRGDRLSPANRIRLIILVALLLGPGGLLVFLSQAKIYYEAIILMVAALLVAFACVQRWIADRRPIYLIVALVAAVIATNSRPSAILPTVILGIGVMLLSRENRSQRGRWAQALGAAITILPVSSALGIMWLKFRAFTPQYSTYSGFDPEAFQRLVDANDGVLQGPRFTPTAIANYLRPDSVSIDATWPWFSHAVPDHVPPLYIHPITPDGLYQEYVASLTTTMPVALALTVAVPLLIIIGVVRLTPVQLRSFTLLGLAAASCAALIVTTFALSTRYLGDFVPLLSVGTVFGVFLLIRRHQGGSTVAGVLLGLIVLSSALTFLVNLGLHQQSYLIPG